MIEYNENKFTEQEYKKELSLHEDMKVAGGAGLTSKEKYRRYAQKLLRNPKSGVFRDFREYGVYPSRVQAVQFLITIPFLVKFMSSREVHKEIVNQIEEKDKSKVEAFFNKVEKGTRDLYEYPTLGDCYTLIRLLQDKKEKKQKFTIYNAPLRNYMMIVNALTYFNIPMQRKILRVRKEYISYIAAIMPVNIIMSELNTRSVNDPRHWRSVAHLSPNSKIAEELIQELVVKEASSNPMSTIMRDLRKISFRHELYNILEKLSEVKEYLSPSIRVVISGRELGIYYYDSK